MNKLIAIACLLFATSFPTFASNQKLETLFSTHFYRHYESGQCGKNIIKFIKAADAAGIDVSTMNVLFIENKGGSVFGMVNAEKATRSYHDGEANWYHHVVAVDDAGLVYDFDFTSTPRIIPIQDYIEEMFLDEIECSGDPADYFGQPCVGRDTKLKDYEISVTPANQLLGGNETPTKKMRMGKVLNDWQIILKP
jgi:hypothetical protein